MRYLNNKIII